MGAFLNGNQEDVGRFGDQDVDDPDLQSVEAFVEAWTDYGETEFTWEHLAVLAWNMSRDRHKIRLELEALGFKFIPRPNVRRIRTIGDNPHDRWHGLGSSPTHSGSGWEQIQGYSERNG
jgi:hypothetical protein